MESLQSYRRGARDDVLLFEKKNVWYYFRDFEKQRNDFLDLGERK
jgi:hypothetical protein